VSSLAQLRIQDGYLALFLGPTQLFVTCSMEKQVEPGINKWQKNHQEEAKFHVVFNQLQVQCLVCITVVPH